VTPHNARARVHVGKASGRPRAKGVEGTCGAVVVLVGRRQRRSRTPRRRGQRHRPSARPGATRFSAGADTGATHGASETARVSARGDVPRSTRRGRRSRTITETSDDRGGGRGTLPGKNPQPRRGGASLGGRANGGREYAMGGRTRVAKPRAS